MYLTARFAADSKKYPLSDIGTYCCVFITLLQKQIAAIQNSNIRTLFLKVNALSFPRPNPTLNLPDSVNKCKTDLKTYLLIKPCYFNFLICRFELFCRTVITQDYISPTSPYSVSYQTNLPSMKTHRHEAGYVRC